MDYLERWYLVFVMGLTYLFNRSHYWNLVRECSTFKDGTFHDLFRLLWTSSEQEEQEWWREWQLRFSERTNVVRLTFS